MEFLAALLVLVGSGCHISDPKDGWANSIWITSVFSATMAILTKTRCPEVLWKVTGIGFILLTLCIMGGYGSLYRTVNQRPADEDI